MGTSKNDVFFNVAPRELIINRRFGVTCRLNIQGRRNYVDANVLDESSNFASHALFFLL
jgi:hypothetical protein